MKRVYLSVRSLLSAGASLLLGWLGFASCSETPESGMAEYGTPVGNYEFKVRVTDQDAKPVEGLQVNIASGYQKKKGLTDTLGEVQLSGQDVGFSAGSAVHFKVKDVDGEKNGIVTDKEVVVDIEISDFVKENPDTWSDPKLKKSVEIQVERK